MPDLYISALGTPYRAVIAHSGGDRAFVRIADRAADDFALDPLVWIDSDGAATGAQAAFLERSGHYGEMFRLAVQAASEADASEWTQRDVLAIVIRRFIAAAEQQCGEAMQRVTVVVPAAIDPRTESDVSMAALIAGAQETEVIALDRIVSSDARRRAVIVEAWDDLMRLTVTGGPDGSDASVVDLTAKCSRALLRTKLLERSDAAERAAGTFDGEIADQLFNAWAAGRDVSHGMTVTRPVARAAPNVVHAPASTFARLDAVLGERLGQALKGQDLDADDIVSITVVGSWTRPVAHALRALLPQVAVRDDRGAELDAAIALVPPQARAAKPSLSVEILAIAESARALRALAQGEPITLLRPGARLPATSVSENFASSSFLRSFSIATKADGAITPMMSVTIPPYAERQPSSYLRTVIHSETPRYVFLEIAYLYPTQRRFSIYDRAAGTELPLADHVFRVVRG